MEGKFLGDRKGLRYGSWWEERGTCREEAACRGSAEEGGKGARGNVSGGKSSGAGVEIGAGRSPLLLWNISKSVQFGILGVVCPRFRRISPRTFSEVTGRIFTKRPVGLSQQQGRLGIPPQCLMAHSSGRINDKRV